MNTKITFGTIGRMAHLEDFVLEKTEETARHFLKDDDCFHMNVHLDSETHRAPGRHAYFKCELLLRIDGRRKEIVIRKFSPNFYEAVLKTQHALKKILRRDAVCKSSLRREKEQAYVADDIAVA